MNKSLLQKLKDWRDKTARRRGVEFYRVLASQALEEIARKLPQTKAELLEIKGIKEKKYAQYGEEILAMVRGEGEEFVESFEHEEKVYEVGEYLDFLNMKLSDFEARVKGEVSSVDARGNYIFFGIKDKSGESLINCFMWARDYAVSGIDLEEGMEIVVWGYPNVFKPGGRLSFQTKLIELVGEGLLKKAYEELKRKLEAEGIFRPERKKPIPDFSHRIGLITSHQGAAIGDFISNIGNYGYKIKFYDSRVEGKQAVFDLVSAVKWFNENMPELDVLVLARGGGSLESLQAFNTEALVREVANSKIPILAGIGHEKDVSLAALAADKMVSTPTAAALELRRPWDEAIYRVNDAEKHLLSSLAGIFDRFEKTKQSLHREFEKIGQAVFYGKDKLGMSLKNIYAAFSRLVSSVNEQIKTAENQIMLNNPERQLKLGYSLVSFGGKIVRSVKNVKVGDEVGIKLSDGKLESEIKKIYDL